MPGAQGLNGGHLPPPHDGDDGSLVSRVNRLESEMESASEQILILTGIGSRCDSGLAGVNARLDAADKKDATLLLALNDIAKEWNVFRIADARRDGETRSELKHHGERLQHLEGEVDEAEKSGSRSAMTSNHAIHELDGVKAKVDKLENKDDERGRYYVRWGLTVVVGGLGALIGVLGTVIGYLLTHGH